MPLLALLLSLVTFGWASVPSQFQGTDLRAHQPVSTKIVDAPKATVVVFLSAKCPCSASHEGVLNQLFQKYSGQGFNFIGLNANPDEAPEFVSQHFKQSVVPFAILKDPGLQWANALGALKTPHAYVISPQGEILYQGGVDDSHAAHTASRHYLSDALQDISQGQKPKVQNTRTLGCVIRRSL